MYIAPRLLISFAVVGSLFHLFVITPKNTVIQSVEQHLNDLGQYDWALQTARQRLKDMPKLSSLSPAQPVFKDYSNRLLEAKGAFSVEVPELPPAIDNKTSNSTINDFNQLLRDTSYRKTLTEAQLTLLANQRLLDYHQQVMNALVNILQYDARLDLKTADENQLSQNLSAAEAGLLTTLNRLKAVDVFESDKDFDKLAGYIKLVQLQRDKLASSIGKPEYSQYKSSFVSAVSETQNKIISNRNLFWNEEKDLLLKTTDLAQKEVNVYLIRLREIRSELRL